MTCIKGGFLHCGQGREHVESSLPLLILNWLVVPKPFDKPWLDYDQQVAKLSSRGLIIDDPAAVASFLSHVNYYRLSGYCIAFQHNGMRHTFVPGTTFEQVHAAYEFDFHLRDLLNEALEIIEVDVRTVTAHFFGKKYGPFGHINPDNFHEPEIMRGRVSQSHKFRHDNWYTSLARETTRAENETFVSHHKKTYSEYNSLPIWVVTEIMSLGSLSTMVSGMAKEDRKKIAERYGLQPDVFDSCLHCLSYTRNLCAHHCRVWDRFWAVSTKTPSGKAWEKPNWEFRNRRLGTVLLIMNCILKECPTVGSCYRAWRNRVHAVMAKPPEAPAARTKMGLFDGWEESPIWQ